jgi:hypothetical protein
MTRPILVACATIAILTLHAVPANAGFWAWLEEFSGPGPFTTGANVPLFLTLCFPETSFKRDQVRKSDGTQRSEEFWKSWRWSRISLGRPEKGGDTRWCLYYDRIRFAAPETPDLAPPRPTVLYPEVRVTTHDLGGSVPIADGMFDIGAGIGWLHVSNARTDNTETRFTITPIRLASRPFFFVSKFRNWDNRWEKLLGSFKVYVKETAVLGDSIGAEDFGSDTTLPNNLAAGFTTPRGELVRSYGFVIDLTDFAFSLVR